MKTQVVAVDPATGTMKYVSLSGDVLRMGRDGVQVPAFQPQRLTFDSPYIYAEHATSACSFAVELSFPGFKNQTLRF
jgi:hypothetical protein